MHEIVAAVARPRKIFRDDGTAAGKDALAHAAQALGIVFEDPGTEDGDSRNSRAERFLVGKLADASGEPTYGRYAPVSKTRADVAGEEDAIVARFTRAHDCDRRLVETVYGSLDEEPMWRPRQLQQACWKLAIRA